MKSLLLKAFYQALDNYTHKASRPGYKPGFFTHWRHSFTKTPKLALLERRLTESKTRAEALGIIFDHFLAKDARFNNHSFNSYLIDALKQAGINSNWDWFIPQAKALKMYQGLLYRGTSQPPEKIFNQGFTEIKASDLVNDYIKFRNGSIGISTSKNFDCAKEYALSSKRSGKDHYIYVINYRGDKGYDLLETGNARGLSFNAWLHRDRYKGMHKYEVNIQGRIDNQDVVGAWQIQADNTLNWLDNSNYRSEREQENNGITDTSSTLLSMS